METKNQITSNINFFQQLLIYNIFAKYQLQFKFSHFPPLYSTKLDAYWQGLLRDSKYAGFFPFSIVRWYGGILLPPSCELFF